ncbi:hypothetical protein RQP46_002184 [Phenoliferia psychrophenolica]
MLSRLAPINRSLIPRAYPRSVTLPAAVARRSYATAGPKEVPKKSDSFLDPKNITLEVTPLLVAIACIMTAGTVFLGRHFLNDPDIRQKPGQIPEVDQPDPELQKILAEDNDVGKPVSETTKK